MIAIITPHFRNFYWLTKNSIFDGEYFETKFADRFQTVFGRNFDAYILFGEYYEVENSSDIIEYLESHGVKRLNL